MKFHLHPSYNEFCGQEDGTEDIYCTNSKDVSCDECLWNMKQSEINLIFNFPRADIFVKKGGIVNQLEHIFSEVEEAYQSALTLDHFHTAVEHWDIIHSSETNLRIMSDDGVDVLKAKEQAEKKNRERGYYD